MGSTLKGKNLLLAPGANSFLSELTPSEKRGKIVVLHLLPLQVCPFTSILFNPIALRKAKIVCNFGLSECNRVNRSICQWQIYYTLDFK